MMERLTSNISPADGPRNTKVVMIGEAPGAEEDYSLRPFIGTAGKFLNRSLARVGIIRESILVTNVFCQRPPRNDISYFYTDKSKKRLSWEGQEHVDQLEKLLTSLPSKPNILVALGDRAMYHLTGKEGITKWRGSILECTLVPGLKVMPTFHPSFVLRMLSEPV